MSLSSIPRALRVAVAERDAGRCRYCGLRQVGQAATFHVDHITPRSRRGKTDLSNLALQCPWCSLHKADKVSGADPETGAVISLFHPLLDDWAEHFELGADGAVSAKTAAGRATIGALRMNDPLPRTARAIQMILDKH